MTLNHRQAAIVEYVIYHPGINKSKIIDHVESIPEDRLKEKITDRRNVSRTINTLANGKGALKYRNNPPRIYATTDGIRAYREAIAANPTKRFIR